MIVVNNHDPIFSEISLFMTFLITTKDLRDGRTSGLGLGQGVPLASIEYDCLEGIMRWEKGLETKAWKKGSEKVLKQAWNNLKSKLGQT